MGEGCNEINKQIKDIFFKLVIIIILRQVKIGVTQNTKIKLTHCSLTPTRVSTPLTSLLTPTPELVSTLKKLCLNGVKIETPVSLFLITIPVSVSNFSNQETLN